MKNLLINTNTEKQRINKNLYYINVEKLIREANNNFIYFKDYEMAIKQVEEALDLDPVNTKALILKGTIFFCINEKKLALECFEKALDIDPSSAEAHSLKANILDVSGNLKEALVSCEKAFSNMVILDKEFLTALFDQKLAILIKLKKYTEAKQTLKQSYICLQKEDSSYITSCYKDVINTLQKDKKRKRQLALKNLKLVYSL